MGEKPEGLILKNQYRMESVLLQTPVGCVYRAFDLSRDKEFVIVKELIPNAALGISSNEIRDRYTRETSMLSRVVHQGIPRLLQYFILEESYYIVLEYFEGETIDSLSMKRTTPFPVREVFHWAISLCEIIETLHTHGKEPIIFRDITPSNILISGKCEIKLGDFGLSRYFNPLKFKDTFVMGTPGFSPPEQYGKGQSDERSDIYSLGATLFYCVSFHSLEEFVTRLPSLRKLNPLLPTSFEKVILKCIERDPDKRYQSVGQLKNELIKCREDL